MFRSRCEVLALFEVDHVMVRAASVIGFFTLFSEIKNWYPTKRETARHRNRNASLNASWNVSTFQPPWQTHSQLSSYLSLARVSGFLWLALTSLWPCQQMSTQLDINGKLPDGNYTILHIEQSLRKNQRLKESQTQTRLDWIHDFRENGQKQNDMRAFWGCVGNWKGSKHWATHDR